MAESIMDNTRPVLPVVEFVYPGPGGPTPVRMVAIEGELLYVGISLREAYRMHEHSNDKGWWSEVAEIRPEHHPNRKAASAAELEAIRTEHPRYNIKGAG